MSVLVDFDSLPWQDIATGARAKVLSRGGQRVRLLELTSGFVEPGWCVAGHAGRVLEGAFTLQQKDGQVRLQKDDTVFIQAGEADAHRAVLDPGERVVLLLFEPA